MIRRLVWAVEKVHGVPYRRAACSRCAWVSEMPFYRGSSKGQPRNTGAIRSEFETHECSEFPGGTRRWNIRPR